ncbi:MAG: DNA-binding protein [Firmicutes bacterium]|uniref:UPF0122 protein IAC13_00320 n=1 Tax=Candidatus Scybalomonas excrementavium TaxID=2840943 RepID=A0A9D9HYY2_9FIRM|nr:DNA-binding protein [Candidatus Scybalomonas excrementavium]
MEKFVMQTLLYDFYGELLTKHQQNIYEDAVLNDMSLSEIAQEQGISRQGVHDIVKRCNKILDGYEEKLHLIEKFLKTKEMVKEIHKCAELAKEEGDMSKIRQHLKRIESVSNEILEEY